MRLVNTLAGSMVAVSLMVAPSAAETAKKDNMDKMGNMADMGKMANMDEFMKSCDMDHDGMMSKAEMLKHMEKMFDKMDTRKTGKLDKKQAEQFLRQFTAPSGA